MPSSLYKTWCQRLSAGTLTASHIRRFASTVSPLALGENPSRPQSMSADECTDLYRRIKRSPVGLTDEHTKNALAWFKNHAVTVLRMPIGDRNYFLKHFDRFTYDGEYVRGSNLILPEWTMTVSDPDLNGGRGLSWEVRYYAPSWQARHYDAVDWDTGNWRIGADGDWSN